jgi:chemotaxis protein CheZ
VSCKEMLNRLDRKVLDIMTELSFQDLTGQQIKKVIQLLKRIEEVSFDAYVTTEVFKKSREHAPDKSVDDIRQKTKEIVQDARAQKDRIDQEGVDGLMEQLGM